VPVVADPNFTTTLVAGTPYLWRGAASEFTVTSNATIKLTYMPIAHVIYINGPLSNATLGSDIWLIYLKGGRPLLVERMPAPSGMTNLFVFKLVNMTKVNGLSVLVPQPFDVADLLTTREENAIKIYTNGILPWRVVNINANATHIGISYAYTDYNSVQGTIYYALPPAVEITSTKITSSGSGVSYVVNGTTVSAYLMPYEHFVIVPTASAKVTIVVK